MGKMAHFMSFGFYNKKTSQLKKLQKEEEDTQPPDTLQNKERKDKLFFCFLKREGR
jgi:hypothetical protein